MLDVPSTYSLSYLKHQLAAYSHRLVFYSSLNEFVEVEVTAQEKGRLHIGISVVCTMMIHKVELMNHPKYKSL